MSLTLVSLVSRTAWPSVMFAASSVAREELARVLTSVERDRPKIFFRGF
jgi:hypothetical protein